MITEVSDDHEDQIEGLVKLCQKLEDKNGTDPVVVFIDENDINMGKFSTDLRMKKFKYLNIISAISPVVEKDLVSLKDNVFDFNEQDVYIEDENCLWVNLYLRYRNSTAIQNLCRKIGNSLREAVEILSNSTLFYNLCVNLYGY